MKFTNIIGSGLIMGSFFLNGLMGSVSEGQQPKGPPMSPFSQTQLKGACRKDPSITFDEEQTKQLENLQRAYLAEAKPLWSELRDLRLELRFAISDPQAQHHVLLDKQRRMSSIQAKLQNLSFSYQMKARSIFTREQLERMPPDCPLKAGIGYGTGMGIGKGRSFPRGIPR